MGRISDLNWIYLTNMIYRKQVFCVHHIVYKLNVVTNTCIYLELKTFYKLNGKYFLVTQVKSCSGISYCFITNTLINIPNRLQRTFK